MKKYLMMGAAALAISSAFVGCSKDKDLYDPTMNAQKFLENYQQAFIEVFGQPAANQTWGFGDAAGARMTRSQAAPEVPGIDAPYNETWVATYNETAKEPNSANVADNYDDSSYTNAQFYANNGGLFNALVNHQLYGNNLPESATAEIQSWYNDNIKNLISEVEWNWNNEGNESYANQIFDLLKNYPNLNGTDYATFWGLTVNQEHGYSPDETFVLNFKITGTYSGGIAVAATEGLTDGVENGNQRTIVVTGTWNITEDQKIGSLGKIIIANGGTVNVQSGVSLEMVNQARLVVLSGGKLTGDGSVTVNNGNAVGQENYNKGTIDVATFNNNFGKFYNYGKFLVNEYQGGAQESNFYNHSLVAIDHTSSTANARIFNGCQFYVKNDARLRNYEGINGSALIVGGQLLFSGSEDGTSDPTYVGLAEGALVKCGSLYNNGTSWSGPTSDGYAALEIVNQIDYLNWEQDAPQNGGYFENNIYVKAGKWDNIPTGNGSQGGETASADYKFWNIIANCRGNNGVTKVNKGSNELLPADSDFKLGETGCTPGFTGDTDTTVLPSLHVMAEDLTAQDSNDFDFNDVVFDVFYVDASTVTIKLLAAGGTLPLRLCANNDWEVHNLYGVPVTCMVNTGKKYHVAQSPYTQQEGKGVKVLTYTGFNSWSNDQSTFAGQVKDNIKIEVQREEDSEWIELTAPMGGVTAKIATPVNIYMKDADWYPEEYRWAWEKQNIGKAFSDWVSNPSSPWYTTK